MFKSGKYYGCISDKEVIKDTNGHGQKLHWMFWCITWIWLSNDQVQSRVCKPMEHMVRKVGPWSQWVQDFRFALGEFSYFKYGWIVLNSLSHDTDNEMGTWMAM